MLKHRSLFTLRYGCAAVSTALAVAVRLSLDPLLGDQFPFATFFFAVTFTAWYGGFGPALLALMLGAFSSDYFLLTPRGSIGLKGFDQSFGLALYLAVSIGIAVLGGVMRAAQRRAETSTLAASRQAALIDHTDDAMFTWELEGPITFWNHGAERLYGISSEQAIGRLPHELLHTTTRGGVPAFRESLEEHGFWEGELSHKTAEGNTVLAESRMVLVREPGRTYVLETNRDVTVRRRVEAELRELNSQLEARVEERTAELARSIDSLRGSEERLAGLVASAMDAIITVDDEQRIVLFNGSAEKMFCCSAEEAFGQPAERFIPERFRAAHREHIENFGRTHVTRRAMRSLGAVFGLRANGEEFPIEASISQLESEGQTFYTVILRDITERMRAEEAVRASEALFSIAFNASPISSVIATLDEGRYVAVNDSFLEVTGYSREEIIGRRSADLGIWPAAEARAEFVDLLKTHGAVRNRETKHRMKNGELRTFLVSAHVIQLEEQPHLITASIDITERKRAEEELRSSEAKLQTIVENLTEGLAVSDLTGRLLHFNKAALDLHGFTSQDEIRLHLVEFSDIFELSTLEGDVLPVDQWPLARILRGENLRNLELRVRRHNSEWQRVFNYGGTLVHDAQGQPMMAIVTIRDITERNQSLEEIRRLNEELEMRVASRTAQLEAVNRELEAFSYSVSHDLRAPLRHINGFSLALLEDYSDKLDEGGKGYLRELRGASQEMAELIDDLLQLARVTRTEIRRERVNLSDLARAVMAEMRRQDPIRNVSLDIEDGLWVNGDKHLLRVALNNLLGNAWKFTARRDQATITFGQTERDGEKHYFVRDNGAGFDMSYSGKLFGAFQRLHSGREFEGTGIGLATVQRVIHRHGGQVRAEGAVNEGATFYFTLPNWEENAHGEQHDPARGRQSER